jgi:hypothetical protein
MSEQALFTRDTIKSMSVEDLKKIVKDPAKLHAYNTFLQTREGIQVAAEIMAEAGETPVVVDPIPTEEVDPAVAEAAARAAKVEEDRLAQEAVVAAQAAAAKAEADRIAQEAAAVAAAEAAKPKKIVVEYQATDENGQPIGRPTHLEASSWEEMSRKQQEAHVQATRAFHRLKQQKTTFKKQEVVSSPLMSEEETAKAAEDLKSDDEVKAIAADRKLRADQILRDQRKLAIERENNHQKEVALEWMTKHIGDYNRCQANGKILAGYLEANDLEWTVDNLDLAFAATESQLAPFEAPVAAVPAPAVVDNPPAAVPQVTTPTPAPVIQPVAVVAAETPVPPAPVPNAPAPAARPGVNASIVPGQSSAPRPAAKPAGLTMKEIHGWTAEQMKKERNNPARRAEIDRVIAAYNKARTARV